MIAALLQYKKEDLETEKLDEIRKYVQAVASRLDYSDWKTFKKLLKEYDLKLDDIDPGCFIRYYMAA